MSDAVPPHGFTVARRGYEIRQVEQAVAEVTAARDRAWQRLADLGELSRQLERQLDDAVRAVAEAEPPSFAGLGERAVRLLELADAEAEALGEQALRESARTAERARTDAARLTADIRTYATRITAGADDAARRELALAREEAEAELAEAGREALAVRSAAEAEAGEVRARAAAVVHESEAWLAARRLAADQEQQQREAELASALEQAAELSERALGGAERHRGAMLARAADLDADAAAEAERLVGAAHREAGRIAAVTAREEELFAEQRAALRAHLDHIRQTLTALVGVAPEAGPEADPGAGPAAGSGAGPEQPGQSDALPEEA